MNVFILDAGTHVPGSRTARRASTSSEAPYFLSLSGDDTRATVHGKDLYVVLPSYTKSSLSDEM